MSSDPPVRLLIIPGLHGSDAAHWQAWLERATPGAVRIAVDDWGHADADRWARAIEEALLQHRAGGWVAVAHSFGCLALARHAARGGRGIDGALLVAPAHPDRFGLDERSVGARLPFASTVVAPANDPWMSRADAAYFSKRWGSALIDADAAGHVHPATGCGEWLQAQAWAAQHVQRVAATLRPRATAAPAALGFAV
jgi:uncharacterized protein